MVKFLHDEPADEDFFGPHSAIARSILETICSDTKIRIIGLSGTWGSGKSTVVRQVAKMIGSDTRCEHYVFFEYDAWLSQSDPPRRSFMEALVPLLISDKLVDKNKWDKKLNQLKGTLQESIKTTTPILTWKSVTLLKTYLLTGIGLLVINKIDLKNVFSSSAAPIELWSLFLSMVLLATAPLAMLAIHIRERFIEKLGPEQRSVVPRLLKKSIDSNRETVNREIEPTSIEFRNEFHELMLDVSKKKKKLLIVLDNVDRLTDEEAILIWSTMRSFFVDRLGRHSDTVEAPVVIVPVDVQSLTRLFAKSHNSTENAKEVAQSYVDKTFDVVFDVREPPIADWRLFFDQSLTWCVGDTFSPWDIHRARRVYEAYMIGKKGQKATPRGIIRLANTVAAIVSTNANVPLTTVVMYALNKTEIEEGVVEWISQEAHGSSDFDPDWKLNIAALYFMTERSKAVGPLLKDEVASAIRDGKPETVLSYADIKGLGDVITQLAHDPPADRDGRLRLKPISEIVTILRDHAEGIDGSVYWRDEAVANLRTSFIGLRGSQPDLGPLQATVEFFASESVDVRQVISTGTSLLQSTLLNPKLSSAQLDVIAAALDSFVILTQRHNLKPPAIALAGDNALALARQYAIFRRSKNWKLVSTSLDPATTEQLLAARLQDPVAHASVPNILQMVSQLPAAQQISLKPDSNSSILLGAIELAITKPEKTDFLVSSVETMNKLLVSSSELGGVVERWADNGDLTARFSEALEQEDERKAWSLIILGLCAGIYFEVSPPANWPDKFRTQSTLAKSAASFSPRTPGAQLDALLGGIRRWPPVQPLLYLLRNYLLADMPVEQLDVPALISDYEESILKSGRAAFLNLLLNDARSEEAISSISLDGLVQLLALPQLSNDARNTLVSAMAAKLAVGSADQWKALITDGHKLHAHWADIKKANPEPIGKRAGLPVALEATSSAAISSPAILRRWLQATELANGAIVHDSIVSALRAIAGHADTNRAIATLKALPTNDRAITAITAESPKFILSILRQEEGRKWIDGHINAVKKGIRAGKEADLIKLRSSLERLSTDKREGRRLWARKSLEVWFGK